MINETITATELARNISASIDRVRVSGNSLYIIKGSKRIAQLSPLGKPGFPIEGLADFLNSLPKLGKDAETMSSDLMSIKKRAELPESSWG